MPLLRDKKQKIIETYRMSENDTGSSAVQIAVLSERITVLTQHMQNHPLDFATRRGLLKLVASRRKLLNYLMRKAYDQYISLINRLGLKR